MQISAEFQEEKIKNKLNKKLSAKKIVWKEKELNKKHILSLAKKFKLSPIISQLLIARGVEPENFNNYFDPKIKDIMPDPFVLEDMKLATSKIIDYKTKKKKIGIFGDYDVDGIVSTAMLGNYFKEIGIDFEYYIPDRIKEGYGPNQEAFEFLRKKNCELIITLDCGITSVEEINFINKKNVEVIIVDHHKQGNVIPDAFAIINPNKETDTSGLKNLCAAGVTFFLLVSLNRELKTSDSFKTSIPNLLEYLDILALATICDVVQLDLMNRAFVKQGLKILNNTKNVGLSSLIVESSIMERITCSHLGFVLGPKINAGGRVGKSKMGVDLLLSDNPEMTGAIAQHLGEYNKLRKHIETQVEKEALLKVNPKKTIICVSSKKWHPGVIGIVASKLSEKFNKPSIVISEDNNLCKASCRSISGFDIGNLVLEAINQKIIQSGGGHKMAAGFNIKKNNINSLEEFLDKQYGFNNCENVKFYDYNLKLSSIDFNLYDSLENFAPFGMGNPQPKFIIENCIIKYCRVVGDYHLTCVIEDIYGNSFKGISFNALKNNIYETLLSSTDSTYDAIVVIKKNVWNGDVNLQLQIEDIVKN